MDDYKKYDELKEKIDRLKLTELGITGRERNDFYGHYEKLIPYKEAESIGELTEEEKRGKQEAMAAIDVWIANFIKDRKENIQKAIDDFERHVKKVISYYEEVKAMFTLDDIDLEQVAEIIHGIENELRDLIGEANQLLADYDELKELAKGYTEGLEFTATYTDIKKRLEELKERLKEIKRDQIAKYNVKVIATNELIRKTKEEMGQEDLSDEIKADLDKLYELEQSGEVIVQWNSNNYLKLDYQKLKETLLLIIKIRTGKGYGQDDFVEQVDLESDMKYIEEKLVQIESEIKEEMTKEEIHNISEELSDVERKITEFEVKLADNKDKISEEEYNNYVNRIEAARKKIEELRNKLVEQVPELYDAFSLEYKNLERDIGTLNFFVNALFGKITNDALAVYEKILNCYESRLNELRDKVEEAKEEGKIDENQYARLQEKLNSLENKLAEIRKNVKDPEIVAAIEKMDLFSFFNGQIDGIETAISKLTDEIAALDAPIKDRKVRKAIDKKFVQIEQEIKDVENFMDKDKDKDPEKYEQAKDRINGLKEKLDKLGKDYRKKCPLHVRVVKSAKQFYKKHKKACLVAAGLAAVALVHATVGPVIIPAIMHGNLMIGYKVPALRGFIQFVNNILGGMINAKAANNLWTLANGVVINPATASTSLLKGLAISGLGSAALLAPLTAGVVVSIKKLMSKMKTSKSHETPSLTDKSKKRKISELIDKLRKKKVHNDEERLNELKELLKDYRASGKTFEEYCEEHGLSEEQKGFLKYFIPRETPEEEVEVSRGGRK